MKSNFIKLDLHLWRGACDPKTLNVVSRNWKSKVQNEWAAAPVQTQLSEPHRFETSLMQPTLTMHDSFLYHSYAMGTGLHVKIAYFSIQVGVNKS